MSVEGKSRIEIPADRHVCPVIAAFMRRWDNDLSTADGDRLIKPLVLRTLGTHSTPDVESVRAWMAADWLVRECAPAWLRLASDSRLWLAVHAGALAHLSPLDNGEAVNAVKSAIIDAWAAAEKAAEHTVWIGANAAWSAATSAVAWDAPRAVADTAVNAAARAAATHPPRWTPATADWTARATARVAANIASHAADIAFGSAAWVATNVAPWATSAVTGGALPRTIDDLQQSALRLIDRMIEAGSEAVTA